MVGSNRGAALRFRIGLWLAMALCVCAAAHGEPVQLELPETYLRYDIEVSLDPASRGLSGRERIAWQNPLDRTVDAVPMHLYLNGFAHEDTSWIRSSSEGVWALSDPRADEAYGWS